MKATALAHSNIAFVKYWGKIDSEMNLPLNNSISMNTSEMYTTTTIEFSKDYEKDMVFLSGKLVSGKSLERIVNHLNIIRKMADKNLKAKIVTENSFPTAAGMASSAGGFAALSLAATTALGIELTEKELTILARRGSGSASRSIPSGFVEWLSAVRSEDSYAYSIEGPDHFDIRDIVAVVSSGKKPVSSTIGHSRAETSPFFKARLGLVSKNLKDVRKGIVEKDFSLLGPALERDAISMHVVTMSSEPPIFYWLPATMKIIHFIQNIRSSGAQAYFTIDAGPNVHIITLPEYQKEIESNLKKMPEVERIISNKPAGQAKLLKKHLF